MTHGIDTDFLVAAEVREHPFHSDANSLLDALLSAGHLLALATQTLAEFIHVVTDPRRMPQPLTMSEAIQRAEHWWQAKEVLRVFPDGQATSEFLGWLSLYQLGRKRLLDTMLTATMQAAGVQRLITNYHRDFAIFNAFEVVTFHS